VLKAIFNFSPATTWLEAAAWLLYLVPTLILYRRIVWADSPPPAVTKGGSSAETGQTPVSTSA
jgi:high-affinity iron transporter